MTRTTRLVLKVLCLGGGFLLWAVAMVKLDDPPRSPKHPVYAAATAVAAAAVLFGACLGTLPEVEVPRPRRARARSRGAAPAPRWHRLELTRRRPEAIAVNVPDRCPCCGQAELGWYAPVTTSRQVSPVVVLLGVLGVHLAEDAATSVRRGGEVVAPVCDPCFVLAHARETWRLLLLSAWFSVSAVACVAAAFGAASWPIVLPAVGALALSAVGLHAGRFGRLRARETSLSSDLGVRGRVRGGSVVLHACDPTWARDVARLNAGAYDVQVDAAALDAHERELKAAGLR